MADYHSQGNLGISTCRDLTCIAVTRTGILTSIRSTMGYPFGFTAEWNALLPRHSHLATLDAQIFNLQFLIFKNLLIKTFNENFKLKIINCIECNEMRMTSAVSVPCLSPDHLRRRISGSVSCYAIFKGWLLLSQPPDCIRNSTSLRCTEHGFRDLNWRSGLFPF